MGLVNVLIAALLFAAAVWLVDGSIYAEKAELVSAGAEPFLALDGKNKIPLPARVAFLTAHDTYLSMSPPMGGDIVLVDSPSDWEMWKMEKVGDKVAFKSAHSTYLSMKWAPMDGLELTPERLSHELWELEEKWEGKVAIKGYNGLYISAFFENEKGVRQMPFPPLAHEWEEDAWEVWTVVPFSDDIVALRTAHGTYLGATTPTSYGTVSQQPRLRHWETFKLDYMVMTQLMISTSSGMYVSADDAAEQKVFPVPHADSWESWTPFVNRTNGKVCLQAHNGMFMHPVEDIWSGLSLSPACMEHELLTVVPVTDDMLPEI